MTEVATNPRAGLAGPTHAEVVELEKEAEAAKTAEAAVRPQKLKAGVNVFEPDLDSYAERRTSGEERLDRALADQEALQAELEELEDAKDVFIARGALEILSERIERLGRAWESNTKSLENAQRLSKLITNLGVPAAEALLAGFALPDVPAAVYGNPAPKLTGPRIEVQVQTLAHDVTDVVGQLRINFVIPRYLHRPIASEVQDVLSAAGCVTDASDTWRVTGQENLEGDLVAVHYAHSRAVKGPGSEELRKRSGHDNVQAF